MAVTEMSKVERATLAGVCSTILLTAGCSAAERDVESPSNTAATSAANPKPTSAGCSVTRPTTEGIPTGVRQTYDGPAFGQEQLWVGAWWSDETLLEEARQHGGIKYPSFTIQDDDVTDELGPPQVSAKRLDGGAKSPATPGDMPRRRVTPARRFTGGRPASNSPVLAVGASRRPSAAPASPMS
jgi:hypothetical protein